MKKIIATVLVLTMSLGLVACGSGNGGGGAEEPASVMSNDYITVNGIATDDTYRDEEESPLRTVYLFYTLNAGDSNLEIDSTFTTLNVGDSNSYESEYLPGLCDYATGYYYSSYIEEVYTGESLNVVATFRIPEDDLEAGKKITISDSQIPEVEDIYFMTDDIQHFEGDQAIAQALDPEGYAKAMEMREDADEERSKEVKSLINGYYWSFFVNNTSYEIEFYKGEKFEVRTAFGSNGGSYSIKNGFIVCTYDSNNYVVEIPYTIENGDIELDVTTAFDVKSN